MSSTRRGIDFGESVPVPSGGTDSTAEQEALPVHVEAIVEKAQEPSDTDIGSGEALFGSPTDSPVFFLRKSVPTNITGKEEFSFRCPQCGARLVSSVCCFNISSAVRTYMNNNSASVFDGTDPSQRTVQKDAIEAVLKAKPCLVRSERIGDNMTLSAGELLECFLRGIGLELLNPSELAQSSASGLAEQILKQLSLSGELADSVRKFVCFCTAHSNAVVLETRPKKNTIPMHGGRSVQAAIDFQISGSDSLNRSNRFCPECGKELGTQLGTAEEVFVGLKGKISGGKTTLLCALAKHFLNLRDGKCTIGASYVHITVCTAGDGAGGWDKGFSKRYENYTDEGIPGNTASNEKVHFTVLVEGWKYSQVNGQYSKSRLQKLITFADSPGELYTRKEDIGGFAAVDGADIMLLCITPGQLSPSLVEKEEEENTNSGQAKNDNTENTYNIQTILNAVLLQNTPGAVLLSKSDMLNMADSDSDRKSYLSILNPPSTETRYDGVVSSRLASYCEAVRDKIDKTPNGSALISWQKNNAPRMNCYFAVSCGKRPGGQPAQKIGIEQFVLWLLLESGLVPKLKIEKQQVKSGFLGLKTESLITVEPI